MSHRVPMKMRHFRCGDPLWNRFHEVAEQLGDNPSEELRNMIAIYNEKADNKVAPPDEV